MKARDGASRDARRALDLARNVPTAGESGVRRTAARALLVLARVDVEQRRLATACERHRLAFDLTDRQALVDSEASEKYWVTSLESGLAHCAGVTVAGGLAR